MMCNDGKSATTSSTPTKTGASSFAKSATTPSRCIASSNQRIKSCLSAKKENVEIGERYTTPMLARNKRKGTTPRSVRFTFTRAAEFDKNMPSRALTPLPVEIARSYYPIEEKIMTKEEIQDCEETKRNTAILDRWDNADFDDNDDDGNWPNRSSLESRLFPDGSDDVGVYSPQASSATADNHVEHALSILSSSQGSVDGKMKSLKRSKRRQSRSFGASIRISIGNNGLDDFINSDDENVDPCSTGNHEDVVAPAEDECQGVSGKGNLFEMTDDIAPKSNKKSEANEYCHSEDEAGGKDGIVPPLMAQLPSQSPPRRITRSMGASSFETTTRSSTPRQVGVRRSARKRASSISSVKIANVSVGRTSTPLRRSARKASKLTMMNIS